MNRVFTAIAFSAVALLMHPEPLSARDLTNNEQRALNSSVAAFEAATLNKDVLGISSVIPPKLIASMAEQVGMEPSQLRVALRSAIEASMHATEIVAFQMDRENATGGVTTEGRPYKVFPTTSVIEMDGNRVKSESTTLSFPDDGVWYLVRVSDQQQLAFLTKAYPEFEGISFPQGSMAIIPNE